MAHAKLTGHHLVTAEKILAHPASHNIEWHDAAALVAEIGSITEESNGRYQRHDRRRDPDLRSAPWQGPRHSADRGPAKDAQVRRHHDRQHPRVRRARDGARSRGTSPHSRAISSRTASRIATRSLNSLPLAATACPMRTVTAPARGR